MKVYVNKEKVTQFVFKDDPTTKIQEPVNIPQALLDDYHKAVQRFQVIHEKVAHLIEVQLV